MQRSAVQSHIEAIERGGYTIIEDALGPDRVEAIGKRVRELEKQALGETERGRPVDGCPQLRTAGLLQLDPLFRKIPILADVLPVIQGILGPECLLTTFSAIDVLPGENREPIHSDDAPVPLPRPHQPVVCTCMIAIDDFTIENGAPRLLPGSHKTTRVPDPGTNYREVDGMIAAEMRAGSVAVFDGALLHQDADNESDAPRLGLEVSYCAPWMRTFTNFYLSIPEKEAIQYPQPLRVLLGYRESDRIGRNRFGGQFFGSYRESYGQLRRARLGAWNEERAGLYGDG
jgi:ectoine hydroxylase-related dioxygenase (phytanoyl-CoA dioxygenase family)